MTKISVEIAGHYEVQKIPYGKDYKWVPAHALIECDYCGHTMDVDAHHTVCPHCGADHTAVAREVAGRHLADEVLHPWHPDYEAWLRFKESHTEYENWLEQKPRE
jgi:ribosomal protein L32